MAKRNQNNGIDGFINLNKAEGFAEAIEDEGCRGQLVPEDISRSRNNHGNAGTIMFVYNGIMADKDAGNIGDFIERPGCSAADGNAVISNSLIHKSLLLSLLILSEANSSAGRAEEWKYQKKSCAHTGCSGWHTALFAVISFGRAYKYMYIYLIDFDSFRL